MKIVILNRDGTINALGSDEFVASPEDWVPLPGALEAIARLNRSGWHVVVASNQPGLGRGMFDVATLNAIHAKMHRLLAAVGGRIDAVFYCPHAPDEECTCRKPAPGLMEQICERYGVDCEDIQVAGNCLVHLQAGAAIGAQLHLVCTGESEHFSPAEPLPPGWPEGTRVHADLAAFADHLLQKAGAAPS
ncbi:D-glycero-beta-D-manno-heptose 1,7-bisphosphate 7-phosphatase [Simplicispira lacusdiani]|uniref:D-glycero-beta-D-manno-heptose 1,7-bisphosphate 7-phosphatase n=1 Tax=Simplicispira lacusdiani TaxID=2213010 RepID=UPI000E727A72|nr:D-glycero-beta-D-manno-heptose 1,7-bisphosphate 7-phosphatase [Simplicispira lacusdiani]